MSFRSFCIAVACTIVATSVDAAPRTFATMSIVGSHLTVVQQRPSVGTNIRGNTVDRVPLRNARFDHAALDEVERAIAKHDGEAKTLRLSAGDAKWVDATRGALVDGGPVASLAAPIVKAAQPTGATHLLLVVPAPADLRFRFTESHAGTGRADGLGLYVDRDLLIRSGSLDETTPGFLGVFAHLRFVVIELASGRVVADRSGTATSVHTVAGGKAAEPLNLLTPEQQVAAIEQLIARVVGDEVPALLKAAG